MPFPGNYRKSFTPEILGEFFPRDRLGAGPSHPGYLKLTLITGKNIRQAAALRIQVRHFVKTVNYRSWENAPSVFSFLLESVSEILTPGHFGWILQQRQAGRGFWS